MSLALEVEAPVCDYCGCAIDEDDKPCPARDKGVCYP